MGQSRFGRGTRVLVVDDNADMRLTTKLLLESEGYVVEVAANGAEALRIQRERPSHILLTDLFMPEVDGLETVQTFRAAFPAMPVIVVSGGSRTGRDQADHLSVARELGAVTLRKPVEPRLLIEAIRTI
jgi:CheY-like chemotaxis protein